MDNIIALAEKIVKAIPGLVDETEEFSCEENISSFDGFSVSENRDDEWDVYLTYKLKYASVERALKAALGEPHESHCRGEDDVSDVWKIDGVTVVHVRGRIELHGEFVKVPKRAKKKSTKKK